MKIKKASLITATLGGVALDVSNISYKSGRVPFVPNVFSKRRGYRAEVTLTMYGCAFPHIRGVALATPLAGIAAAGLK